MISISPCADTKDHWIIDNISIDSAHYERVVHKMAHFMSFLTVKLQPVRPLQGKPVGRALVNLKQSRTNQICF